MNKTLLVIGLVSAVIGIGAMIYFGYPLYQANYAIHYNSTAQWCNATDPYLHPELGSASWGLLLSGFPFVLGLTMAGMGVLGGSFNSDNKTKGGKD